ncbi:hypothetical protein ACFWAP_00445 [Streptomyces goshikiensis]|uniref:hypothetical protein n=1 Tax=Streptomyces goshikiensis TaxID=1942 RepID=UPI00365B37A3
MRISRTLAAKLSWLMDHRTDANGDRWTSRSLALETAARGDGMSHATVGAIAKGTNANPRIQTIETLALALGVPASFFLRGYTEEDLPALALLDIPRIRRIVHLMQGLTGEDFDKLEDTLHLIHVRRGLEGEYIPETATDEAPKKRRPGRRRTLTEAAKRAADTLE